MQRFPVFERLRHHRLVAGLVLLGFLCRALIPVGFMPAAIGAGGPFAVCHGGLAGEFFRRLAESTGADAGQGALQTHAAHDGHAGHAGHAGLATDDMAGHTAHGSAVDPAPAADQGAATGSDEAPASAHEAWDHCPVGAASGAAAFSVAYEFSLPILNDQFEAIEPAALLSHQFASSYRARAPPARPHLS